jgi:hypothetical protein
MNSFSGYWFDGNPGPKFVPLEEDPDFAPEFVLQNMGLFMDLLVRSQ